MNYYNDLGTNQAAVYTFGPADVVQTVTNFIGYRIFGMEILSNTKNSRPRFISTLFVGNALKSITDFCNIKLLFDKGLGSYVDKLKHEIQLNIDEQMK